MEHITTVVVFAALAAMAILFIVVAIWTVGLRRARRDFRSTVEGLAVRTHQAARVDQERARGSAQMAEATRELMLHVAEVQDTLALERKLRKALASAGGPASQDQRENSPDRGVSA